MPCMDVAANHEGGPGLCFLTPQMSSPGSWGRFEHVVKPHVAIVSNLDHCLRADLPSFFDRETLGTGRKSLDIPCEPLRNVVLMCELNPTCWIIHSIVEAGNASLPDGVESPTRRQ